MRSSARVLSTVGRRVDALTELYFYLIHVRLDQNLTHKGLRISSLVDGGVCPQAVAHHVHVGRLEAFNQQTLQGLLQHGGDPCNSLRRDRNVITRKSYKKKLDQHIKKKWIKSIFKKNHCSPDGSIEAVSTR